MKRIKNALVEIFWLMLAAIPMILVGLVYYAAAVYVSVTLLAAFFLGIEALGPLSYVFVSSGAALGAGAILLCVRCANQRTDPQSVKAPIGPPESE